MLNVEYTAITISAIRLNFDCLNFSYLDKPENPLSIPHRMPHQNEIRIRKQGYRNPMRKGATGKTPSMSTRVLNYLCIVITFLIVCLISVVLHVELATMPARNSQHQSATAAPLLKPYLITDDTIVLSHKMVPEPHPVVVSSSHVSYDMSNSPTSTAPSLTPSSRTALTSSVRGSPTSTVVSSSKILSNKSETQHQLPSPKIQNLINIFNYNETNKSLPDASVVDERLEYAFSYPTYHDIDTMVDKLGAWSGQEIVSCLVKKYSARPHLSFIGDSVSRTGYNLLMRRLGVAGENENAVEKGVQWNNQIHRVSVLDKETGKNATFSFTFLSEFWRSEERLAIHSLDAGILVGNSGLWEMRGRGTDFNNPEILKGYIANLARFAVNVRKLLPSDTRLVWRQTTPVFHDHLDEERKRYMSNFKIRAFNTLAQQVLAPKPGWSGFDFIDPRDSFAAAREWLNAVQDDAYHPIEYITQIFLDQIFDRVCGDGSMDWTDLEYLASLKD
ncbi:hypothetical protein BDR26DRAFT_895340 [Obelidium mucronatum]|nr:hypothetical protein BDR26DRAFT_895340 [Obelidium mucronatum]